MDFIMTTRLNNQREKNTFVIFRIQELNVFLKTKLKFLSEKEQNQKSYVKWVQMIWTFRMTL
jgi:hypothetical protein